MHFGNETPSIQAIYRCYMLMERVDDLGPCEPSEGSDEGGFVKWIASCLQENAGWLQTSPRNVIDIVDHIFPQYSQYQEDLDELAPVISNLLRDSCYSPRQGDSIYPTWCWLEGNTLPSNEITLVNAPLEEMTPPLFITPVGGGSIPISTGDVFKVNGSIYQHLFVNDDSAEED